MAKRTPDVTAIAAALGASNTESLERQAHGPLGLLHLRDVVQMRIRSTGGRPTDPDWNLRRVVPFKADRWHELEQLAKKLSESGQNVSPAQLAALLIEQRLESLQAQDIDELLEPTG